MFKLIKLWININLYETGEISYQEDNFSCFYFKK